MENIILTKMRIRDSDDKASITLILLFSILTFWTGNLARWGGYMKCPATPHGRKETHVWYIMKDNQITSGKYHRRLPTCEE